MARCTVAVVTLASVCAFLAFAGVALAAPIHEAAEAGRVDEVRSLLEADRSLVNSGDAFGSTPLHRAAENGHKDVVALLIANGRCKELFRVDSPPCGGRQGPHGDRRPADRQGR